MAERNPEGKPDEDGIPEAAGKAIGNAKAGVEAGRAETDTKDSKVVNRRRLVALAGYQGDEASAREGVNDDAGDVRATALGALHRMGRLSVADLQTAIVDPSPAVRRRACELSAALAASVVIDSLNDPDPLVVEAACFALGERGADTDTDIDTKGVAVPALVQVAAGHADALCREAAIAALGAIGDLAGLSAILGGLSDKPAVRRRAVIALAPFEGPEVDEALAKARTDRDWQVRQAAEDLS